MRDAYKILVGKLEGKRQQLARQRHRWEDVTKMGLNEI
jgi:hypothetical protein